MSAENKTQPLVGLDFTDLDAEYAKAYAHREALHARKVAARNVADKAVHHQDAPEAEVDVSALTARLQEAQEAEVEFERKKSGYAQAKSRLAAAEEAQVAHNQAMLRLQKQIETMQRELEVMREDQAPRKAAAVAECRIMLETAKEAAQDVPDLGIAAIRKDLAEAGAVNAKVRENVKRIELQRAADDLEAEYAGHTARIEAIRKEKAERLAAVTFPVPGLSVSDTGGRASA